MVPEADAAKVLHGLQDDWDPTVAPDAADILAPKAAEIVGLVLAEAQLALQDDWDLMAVPDAVDILAPEAAEIVGLGLAEAEAPVPV